MLAVPALAAAAAFALLRQTLDRGAEVFPARHVLHEPERHADAGAGKAQVPVDPLREIAGDEGAERRAQVDPHVEDREPGVAARVARS